MASNTAQAAAAPSRPTSARRSPPPLIQATPTTAANQPSGATGITGRSTRAANAAASRPAAKGTTVSEGPSTQGQQNTSSMGMAQPQVSWWVGVVKRCGWCMRRMRAAGAANRKD
jgi:hypothetical protein